MNEANVLAPQLPIVMVDDEEHILASYDMALRLGGYTNITQCNDSRDVTGVLEETGAAVLLLDLTMPHISGETLLVNIAQNMPEIPVVVVTGNDSLETAVKCMRQGAFDFLVKPVERDRLITTVKRALAHVDLSRENRLLSESLLTGDLKNPQHFTSMVTNNPGLRTIFQYVEAIAPSEQPVLITGETGVGKELLARAVHDASARSGKMVCINVAGLDEHVFADTLFGHVRGAFTGAETSRSGLVQQAAGGSLFLDEIGDLSPSSQVKLLRFIQEKEYYPVGADLPGTSDARVIVATHQDIDALHSSGDFRKDLYYRLCTHRIKIPPLRERLDDIELLLEHLLEEASRQLNKKVPRPPKELISLLSSYHYPGNVRELHSMVFDAVSRHNSMMLSMDSFKEYIFGNSPVGEIVTESINDMGDAALRFGTRLPTMNEAKRLLTDEALRRTGGNKSLAASMLGMTRQALSRREKMKTE